MRVDGQCRGQSTAGRALRHPHRRRLTTCFTTPSAQRIVTTIFNQSTQYRVILVAKRDRLPDLKTLRSLYLPTQTAATGQVPLSGVADIKAGKTPLVISHLAQFPPGHHLVQPDRERLAQHGGRRS